RAGQQKMAKTWSPEETIAGEDPSRTRPPRGHPRGHCPEGEGKGIMWQGMFGKENRMIRRVYIDNYKCLTPIDVQLDELTLLLGPNGVGKTSILDVMFALRQLLAGIAKVTDRDVFPPRTLTRWEGRDVQVFELEAELGGEVLTYRLEVQHDRSARRARITL